MTLGIREDRLSASKSWTKHVQLAKSVGLDCVELALDKKPAYEWWLPYEKALDIPIVGVCANYWLKEDWIAKDSPTWPIKLTHAYVDIAVTCIGALHLQSAWVLLPCLDASRVDSDERAVRVLEMVTAIGAPHVAVEWDLTSTAALAIVAGMKTTKPLCYDLGNERSRKNGQLKSLKAIANLVGYCHLKHRAWGSDVTEHLPPDEKERIWYRARLDILRSAGFDGPVILETPVAAQPDEVKQDIEAARWILGGD